MVVMEPDIIDPSMDPGKKSSPSNELLMSLLPETEFREKSSNVTPALAKYSLVMVLSEIISFVTAPSAILSVVTELVTK
jgi:hypothetical protein